MQVAAMVAVLLRTKGLAIILGPGAVGVMAVIDKLIAVVSQTASLSLPFAAIRFLPSLHESPVAFHCLRRAMALTVLALTVAAAAGAAAVAMARPAVWGAQFAGHESWLLVGLLTVPVVACAAFLPNAFAGGLDHRGAMGFTVTHALVLAASGLFGAWFDGVRGVYAAYAILGGVLVASRVRRLVWSPELEARGAWRLPTSVWRFGLAMIALAWVVPYAALFTHYQVLRYFGANTSGYMQAAMGIAVAVRTVLGAGHQLFLTPHVNRSGTPADRLAWAVRYQRTLALLVGVLAPPLLLCADVAVRVLYSSAFLPASPYVWLFVIVEVLTLFAGTYQSLILAFDHLTFHVVQNLAAQVVVIVLAFALVPTYGVAAAAAAPLGGQAVIWAGTLLFLRRGFGLRVPRPTALLTAAAIAAVVLAGIVGAQFAWTMAGVGARLAVWVAGLALLGACADEDERTTFARVLTIGPRGWAAQIRAVASR